MFLAKYTEPLQSKALKTVGNWIELLHSAAPRAGQFSVSKRQAAIMIRNGDTATPCRQQLRVFVNGRAVCVPADASVAAAILQADVPFRRSVSGEPRAALCAMGICEECRATVDGVHNVRTCQHMAAEGMEIIAG